MLTSLPSISVSYTKESVGFLCLNTKRAAGALLPQADRWLSSLPPLLPTRPLSSSNRCQCTAVIQCPVTFPNHNTIDFSTLETLHETHATTSWVHINISYFFIMRFTDRGVTRNDVDLCSGGKKKVKFFSCLTKYALHHEDVWGEWMYRSTYSWPRTNWR
jgi:hypothetical protein